ncbi:hypothetical protein MRX96_000220 [Rhipicephalus microplus]
MVTLNNIGQRTLPCALLSVAGGKTLVVYNNLTFDEGEDKQDNSMVAAKLESYYVEQENTIHERYVFRY